MWICFKSQEIVDIGYKRHNNDFGLMQWTALEKSILRLFAMNRTTVANIRPVRTLKLFIPTIPVMPLKTFRIIKRVKGVLLRHPSSLH